MFHAPTPSRLHQRFPFLESLTLKGFPVRFPGIVSIDITPWIQDISASFKCLKELCISGTVVHDSDLELLFRTRGKHLRVLKIIKSQGFSTDGLLHIGTYCKDLRTLSIRDNSITPNDGKWLHKLASHIMCIESLIIGKTCSELDVEDLILIAKNCSKSLKTLKIHGCDLTDLVDVFSYAVNLEDFAGANYNKNKQEGDEYAGFKFPPKLRHMGIYCIRKTLFPFLLPLADQHNNNYYTYDWSALWTLIMIWPKLQLILIATALHQF
ncbi:coronatine-insensitive protein 1-like protein [Tanacetum coccineum]